MKTIPTSRGARATASGTGLAPRRRAGSACARPLPAWRDFGGEKVLRGLLVLVAAVGIGYGFSCLVDLVQGCALFVAEVGRLLP